MARGSKRSTDDINKVKFELIKSGDNPNCSEIARRLSMPNQTVYDIKNTLLTDEDFIKAREVYKKTVTAKLQELAEKAIQQSLDKLSAANAFQAATIAGIAVDKAQLLSGEATSILENRKPTDTIITETEQQLDALKRLKARKQAASE